MAPTGHPARAASLKRAGGEHPAIESAASGRWLDIVRRGAPSLSYDQLVRDPDWREIVALVERLGRDPSHDLPPLARYARLVLAWNRSVSNLISRSDESRIVSRHLKESIEPAPLLLETGVTDWLDFGSGAGLPALPLVVVGVGAEWNLVESRRPKVLFIRRAIQELGLTGVHVTHARLEEVVAERQRTVASAAHGLAGSTAAARAPQSDALDTIQQPRGYGGFTSRATLNLAPTLSLAARIVRPGGFAFLWKGSRRSQELAERGEWAERWELVSESVLSSGQVAVCKFSLRG